MATVWHVYDIVLDGVVVYVGMTSDPKRRLAKHRAFMFEGDESMAIVARFENIRDAQMAEADRIRDLQPPRNRSGLGGRSLSSEQARANGAKAGAKRGRPKATFDDAARQKAETIWHSRRVATWADAEKLLEPLGYTTARAYKEFGPRGGSQKSRR